MIEIAENDIIKLFGEKIALTKDLFKSKEFGRKVQKIIDILNTGINKIEIKKIWSTTVHLRNSPLLSYLNSKDIFAA